MTKNEKREFDIARTLAAGNHLNMAARTIAIVHRSTRSAKTQAAALALVAELDLTNRVTMYNGCLAHIDDVPAVRS